MNHHTLTLCPLAARVSFSQRTAIDKQTFQFLDLFHDKPPFINGTFAFWKRDNDASAVFLADGGSIGTPKMARVIGRVSSKRFADGETKHDLQIMNIRQTDWAEIDTVRKIICEKN